VARINQKRNFTDISMYDDKLLCATSEGSVLYYNIENLLSESSDTSQLVGNMEHSMTEYEHHEIKAKSITLSLN
jgi:hypothetical protein